MKFQNQTLMLQLEKTFVRSFRGQVKERVNFIKGKLPTILQSAQAFLFNIQFLVKCHHQKLKVRCIKSLRVP